MKRVVIALGCLITALHILSASAADLAVVADANTDNATPNTNLGSNGIIAVSGARIGLIRFDNSQLATSTGGHALLHVKVLAVKNSNSAVSVRFVDSAWDEKTVTAATLPSIWGDRIDQRIITTADVGKTMTFDISSAVATWRNDPARNFGLALVGLTPVPNVSLGSREGGSPATLSTSGPPSDNDVTVAISGGDYSNLGDAIRNMKQGDGWCLESTAQKPCTIHVGRGIFLLQETLSLEGSVRILGEERGETVIIARGGRDDFETIFTAAGFAALSDLTLVSDGTCIHGGGVVVERVVLRCRQLFNLDGGGFSVTDSDLTATSDAAVEAISLFSGAGPSTITRSRVTGISRQDRVLLIRVSDATSYTQMTFTDSTLSAWGKLGANAFLSSDEAAALMTVLRSSVEATSPQDANGLSGNGSGGIQLIDSHVNAHGGSGLGLEFDGGGPVIIDNSTIDASSRAAVLLEPVYGSPSHKPDLTVLRSQLHAGELALQLTLWNAHIENSVVVAKTVAELYELSSLNAASSQLAGRIAHKEGGTTATCDHVYDGNLAWRPANCVGP